MAGPPKPRTDSRRASNRLASAIFCSLDALYWSRRGGADDEIGTGFLHRLQYVVVGKIECNGPAQVFGRIEIARGKVCWPDVCLCTDIALREHDRQVAMLNSEVGQLGATPQLGKTGDQNRHDPYQENAVKRSGATDRRHRRP